MSDVVFDMRGFQRMETILRNHSGPFQDMFTQWGSRYTAFTRRRFQRNARGGGDWAPLKASTLKSRRGGTRRKTRSPRALTKTTTRGSAKKVSILIDNGILFNALTVGAPGHLLEVRGDHVRVGYDNSSHGSDSFTIADLAMTHQEGNPGNNLPARPIFVEPDKATVDGMMRDTKRAVQTALRQSAI